MANVNILGVVENINLRTNVYTPIIEGIVNAIDSINSSGRKDGEVIVTLIRSTQGALKFEEDAKPDIKSIIIQDNGVGFNDENTNSFDTLYSRFKIEAGGKGFGRFMFLKYFEDVRVESIFRKDGEFHQRTFDFGKNNDMVANPKVKEVDNSTDTRTVIYLDSLKQGILNKKNSTIARKLLENLLIYFIDDKYTCPNIVIREDGEKDIVLNDLISGNYAEIQKVGDQEFELTSPDNVSQKFQLKVFKIFYPDNQKSKISLTAHNREVTDTPIYNYIPEFEENFYEETEQGVQKDFMIKSYVLGKYLDNNVLLERNAFKFPKKGSDMYLKFSQEDIEREAARITNQLEIFKEEINLRKDKKKKRVLEYINTEAPWHKVYIEDIDFATIPYNLNSEGIDLEVQKVKFEQEQSARVEVKKILESPSEDIDSDALKAVEKLSKANISELAHYITLRRLILNLFKKSLEIKSDGEYSSEGTVHDIIFPTKTNSDNVPYDNHNLWIIDEKLNFTEFVSSDEALNGGTSERTDLLIFNKKMAFRGDNEASNPITIFEFKRPQRDDFVNHSSKEDPVQQVIRYVNDIKDGKFKTPKGRDILVGENTPFYGFIVCDLTKKVKDWLLKEQDFKEMPDSKGWFKWFSNINLYIEVLSWEKVLADSEMRNKIFFHKLGLD